MSILNKKNGKVQKLQEQISELKGKIEANEKEKARYEQIESQLSSLLSSGYFSYNYSDKSFLSSSSLTELFTGYLTSSIISPQTLIDSVHPDDKSLIEDLFTEPKSLNKKINGQFRLTQRIKDYKETKTFQIIGTFEKSHTGQVYIICIVRDITREIKQIKDIQRNYEKALEADRIKTMFLLNISHYIRTPMNSIMGFSELLSMTDPGADKRNEFIEVIKKQSKNLLQLIDDVAEIAKYESGTLTITKILVNLNQLINEIVRDVNIIRSESRKEHVKIQVKLPVKKGLEMYTDAGRLHQVFVNILNHSLTYTTQGSIELGYKIPADNRIEFYVKDTSQGLDKEDLKNILDRFGEFINDDSNKYNESGGLSLMIAKSIVKLLGGKLIFEANQNDPGFTFSFQLSYEEPPQLTSEPEDELHGRRYKWNNKVILIVEDEEVNGIFLEAVFQETGARTLYAKNGKQAVELCQSINKIDLILMDIKMPVMNGIKATEEIRKFNKTIPVIAQTALATEEDHYNCMQAGCNDTVIKPIDVAELLELANKYLIH